MSSAISLKEKGIRVFACRFYNHDYLWFSSYEISKISSTIPVIHNYALTYSFGDYSYGVFKGSVPRYKEDLARIPLYATPALANYWSRTRITYNAVNSHSLRTDDAPRGINSPDLGWRNYLDPVYPGGGHNAQQTGFICYLFTFDGRIPKGVTRLGKKGTAMRVCWQEIENPVAVFRKEPIQPTHPINPLDISGEIVFYEPVSIPPHMLFKTAEVKNDWFIFAGPHRIHIPNQVINRGCKKDG